MTLVLAQSMSLCVEHGLLALVRSLGSVYILSLVINTRFVNVFLSFSWGAGGLGIWV
jgi:hypothetical protein